MNILVFFASLLLTAIVGITIVLFLIFAFDSLLRGHDLSTSRRVTRALVEVIRKHKPNAKKFYDLGCAHGDLSLAIKKILPNLEIYAVDNSSIRIFFAKLKSKILGRSISFIKQDIFDTNVRSADIVYTYLWYDVMPPLEKKLQNELKRGAIVVTNTSNFPVWEPIHKIITYPKASKTPNFETLFVYLASDFYPS